MKKILLSVICAVLIAAMLPLGAFAEGLPENYQNYRYTSYVGGNFAQRFTVDAPDGWTEYEIRTNEEKTNALSYGLDFVVTPNYVAMFGIPTKPGTATLAVTLTADGKEPVEIEFNILIYPIKIDAKDELEAEVGEKVEAEFVYTDYGIYLLKDWNINFQKSKIASDDLGLKFTVTESELIVEGKAKKAGTANAHLVFDIGDGECSLDVQVKIIGKGDNPVIPTDPQIPDQPAGPQEPTKPVDPSPVFVFPFVDVKKSDWFYDDVYKAVEMGLVDGKTKTEYKPNDNMTYAEAIKLAACMNQKYTEGKVTLKNGEKNWYDTYVEYAKANGIPADFADMNAKITRADFAHIFANALPEACYAAINEITAIPDVAADARYADEILALYNAGILTGSDAKGTFNPDSFIKRSEVAAIVTRMMNDTTRKTFSL